MTTTTKEIDDMPTTFTERKTTARWLTALADDLGTAARCIHEAVADFDGILAGHTRSETLTLYAAATKLVAQAAELESCAADLAVVADRMAGGAS